jgi:hypothetical protein
MKKPVSARGAAFLFVLGIAVAHCGGDDTSTTSSSTTSGGSGGGTTGATTGGAQTTATVGVGTTSTTSAGAGGFAGATGTGGAGGGSIGNCPATQPAAGTSCTAFAACPFGSVVCICVGAGGGARSWMCPDLDGFSFDANFGRPDAGG